MDFILKSTLLSVLVFNSYATFAQSQHQESLYIAHVKQAYKEWQHYNDTLQRHVVFLEQTAPYTQSTKEQAILDKQRLHIIVEKLNCAIIMQEYLLTLPGQPLEPIEKELVAIEETALKQGVSNLIDKAGITRIRATIALMHRAAKK